MSEALAICTVRQDSKSCVPMWFSNSSSSVSNFSDLGALVGDGLGVFWVVSPEGKGASDEATAITSQGSPTQCQLRHRLQYGLSAIQNSEFVKLVRPNASAPSHDDLVVAFSVVGSGRTEYRRHVTTSSAVHFQTVQIEQAFKGQGRLSPRRRVHCLYQRPIDMETVT